MKGEQETRTGVLSFAAILFLTIAVSGKPPEIESFSGPVEEKIPMQGDTLRLDCKIKGNPKPSLWFLVNGTRLLSDSRITYTDTTVVIRQVDYRKDDGYYQCLAENEDGAILSKAIWIQTKILGNFAAPNRRNDSKIKVYVNVGKPFELPCPNHTYTYPSRFSWGGENTTIDYGQTKGRYYLPNGNLYFPYLEVEHLNLITKTGGARCRLHVGKKVRESVGTTLHVTSMAVKAYSPFFRLSLPSVTIAVKDKQCRLLCATAGNPLPTIKWFKDNKEIRFDDNNNYNTSESEQDLIIKKVDDSSAGLYSCLATNKLATNKVGRNKSEGRVEVVSPPRWKTMVRQNSSKWNANAYFYCEAAGTLPISYHWFWNGKNIVNNTAYTVNKGTLTLKSNAKKRSGVVQCLARNEYGNIISSTYFQVKKDATSLPRSHVSWGWVVTMIGGIFIILGAVVITMAYFKYKEKNKDENGNEEQEKLMKHDIT